MLNGRRPNDPNDPEELLRQLRTLTEVIPQIVWSAGADGTIDYVNHKWLEYSGVDFAQTQKLGWQPALHPDDIDMVSLNWRECLVTGEAFECEARLRRFDGVYHWHLMRALPLKETSGKIVKWCGTNTDINDQKSHIDDLEKRIMEDPAKLKQTWAPANKTMFADRYVIEGVLSTGGMGSIYRAKHIHMARVVAIKILHPFLHGNLKLIKQFRQEAEAAAGLIHPNIVTVFDFGVTKSGEPFLVMDYIDGKSLENIVNEDGHLELQRFMRIFIQVCEGLQEAHSKGIVHCDIKPGNIVLGNTETGKEVPKIVDFGIARINPREVKLEQKATMDFSVAGSPRYMSPEQCVGEEVDERSDIYSLACVMYECLTGRPVFDDITVYELFNKHVNYPPKSFDKICPELRLPAALEELLMEMLEKKAEMRVQTAQEVRRRLLTIYREMVAPTRV